MKGADVVVVGAGSMGLLLATALTDAGVPAAVVVRRPETVAALRQGVAVTTPTGVKTVPVDATADVTTLRPPAFVVMAVKSYDLAAALAHVVPWAARGTTEPRTDGSTPRVAPRFDCSSASTATTDAPRRLS